MRNARVFGPLPGTIWALAVLMAAPALADEPVAARAAAKANVAAEEADAAPAKADAAPAKADAASARTKVPPAKILATCAGCHDLSSAKKKMVGPPLMGMYGQKPLKSVLKFARWDDDGLYKFLADPSKLDPDTRMPFKIRDPDRRLEVIAAMRDLK